MRISDWSSDVCSSDLNSRSTRDFLAFEQRRDDLFDTPALDLGRRRQDDAVAKHPGGEALDVVGNDIIASIQRRRRACGAREQSRRKIGRASCRERVCKYV